MFKWKFKREGTKYKLMLFSIALVFIFLLSSRRIIFNAPSAAEDTYRIKEAN